MMTRQMLLLAALMLPLVARPQGMMPRPGGAPDAIMKQVGLDQKLGAQLPATLAFVDESGRPVTLGQYFGTKPVVLALVYYSCPMLCTEVLNGMHRAFQFVPFRIGKDFDVVTVSINPEETPELAASKKAKYLDGYQYPEAKEGWHFLTGKEPEIRALAAAVGYRYMYDDRTKQYAHPAGIIVLTPEGAVSRYLYGVEYRARDLKLALVEASGSKIGGPAERVLLLCYRYDPEQGTYGLVIMNVIRIAFVITVLALGIFIALALRLDRKKRVPAGAPMPAAALSGGGTGAQQDRTINRD